MRLTCPHCNSHVVRPEPFRWYEWPLALLFLHPYRCRRCGSRFIGFAGVPKPPRLFALK
jgi:DNA-directed RNA polymerase subunit RPC12/RpoP